MSTWVHDDGGRAAAGYQGDTRDCATRAAAIVTGVPYAQVYAEINELAKRERPTERKRRSHARTGVHADTLGWFMQAHGFRWVPTMGIGTGCRVHLRASELPGGRILARCTKHFTAVIGGVIHDTYDPSRGGTRCVYGYWEAL